MAEKHEPTAEKTERAKRTRRPLTPETALGNILVTLAKLAPEERGRVLRTASAWLDQDKEAKNVR